MLFQIAETVRKTKLKDDLAVFLREWRLQVDDFDGRYIYINKWTGAETMKRPIFKSVHGTSKDKEIRDPFNEDELKPQKAETSWTAYQKTRGLAAIDKDVGKKKIIEQGPYWKPKVEVKEAVVWEAKKGSRESSAALQQESGEWQQLSNSMGQTYYYNSRTGFSQWDNPHETADSSAYDSEGVGSSYSTEAYDRWETYSDTSGTPYYFNNETGVRYMTNILFAVHVLITNFSVYVLQYLYQTSGVSLLDLLQDQILSLPYSSVRSEDSLVLYNEL